MERTLTFYEVFEVVSISQEPTIKVSEVFGICVEHSDL